MVGGVAGGTALGLFFGRGDEQRGAASQGLAWGALARWGCEHWWWSWSRKLMLYK